MRLSTNVEKSKDATSVPGYTNFGKVHAGPALGQTDKYLTLQMATATQRELEASMGPMVIAIVPSATRHIHGTPRYLELPGRIQLHHSNVKILARQIWALSTTGTGIFGYDST